MIKSKKTQGMRKSLILLVAACLLASGSAVYAGGFFHPFRHRRCENVCPASVPYVNTFYQEGIFKTVFLDGHTGYAFGYVNGDGYIYVFREVPDPFHPGVVTDVEQVVKDLENDILKIFDLRRAKLVGPKVETK